MPPPPSLPPEPVVSSRNARRCTACSGPLVYQGVRPLRTAAGVGMAESALVLEMFWCPHCAKVEFYSSR